MKLDRLGGGRVGGNDEVALVLSVGVVDDHHHAAARDGGDGVPRCRRTARWAPWVGATLVAPQQCARLPEPSHQVVVGRQRNQRQVTEFGA